MKVAMKIDPRETQKFKVKNFDYDPEVEGSEEYTDSIILYKPLSHLEVTRIVHSNLENGKLTPRAGEEIADVMLHKLITGWEGFTVDDPEKEGEVKDLPFSDDLVSFIPTNIRLDFIDKVISPMTAPLFKIDLPKGEVNEEEEEIKN